ncbi:hypothetical protein PMIN03_003321 [Paraphaeosphaeria minitans]
MSLSDDWQRSQPKTHTTIREVQTMVMQKCKTCKTCRWHLTVNVSYRVEGR